MDTDITNNAISVSSFTKELIEWIWEKKRLPFERYN